MVDDAATDRGLVEPAELFVNRPAFAGSKRCPGRGRLQVNDRVLADCYSKEEKMLNRRNFLSRALSSALLPLGAALRPRTASASSSSLSLQEGESAQADWTRDSRWGSDYWRRNEQSVELPNKARVACLCSIPFESYDPVEGPPENSAAISNIYYGGKVGVWRILEILDRHNVKGNFVTNALCAVQFPEAVQAIAGRGHEIVGHFWANNIREDQLTVERDRGLIRRSLSTLEQVTGQRPVSWVAPGWWAGPKTLDILAEEGLTSHANSPSIDDLPYTVTIAGKKIVVIIQETVLNDNGFFNNFNGPSTFVEYLKRDFDRKYAEAAKRPKIFNFVLHAHLGGRPFMAEALDEILSYVQSFPDVWFTVRQPLVNWWLERGYR